MIDRKIGGRFQTVHLIGAGGMGRVFQAVDLETGQAVAAKILTVSDEVTLDMLLRFQQEGAVLSTLEHPNIVEVYGTHLEKHTSCIIMELLEGRSLSEILRSEQLSLARTKRLAQQVASALAYAHSRAIVHRDIKPHNIMVVRDDHVKVTDFGIARILREGSTLATATGMTLGTPLYMAPEQIESHTVDGRADIYSLGAVLYQMVTGRPPFEGKDPLSIAFQHVHRAPHPPRAVSSHVPEDWEALILKALAKDPGARFQNAVALEQAISSLSTGEMLEGAAAAPLSTGATGVRVDEPDIRETDGLSPHREAAPRPASGEPAVGRGRLAEVEKQPGTGDTRTGMGSNDTTQADGVNAQSVLSVRRPQERRERAVPWLPIVGGVVALSVIFIAAFFVLRGGASKNASPTAIPPTAKTAPIVPSLIATTTRNAVSGHNVKLQWTVASQATNYRLQVATLQSDPSDSVVFKHPFLTKVTTKTSYSLKVVGHQYYFWRVRAEVGGKWNPYSHSQHFSVPQPIIGRVWLLLPTNGTRNTARQMRMCWTGMKGAYDYTLQVSGSRSIHIRSTCTWISVRPGDYQWRVAARVKAAHLYTGLYSDRAYFTIQKPRPRPTVTPTPAPQPTTAPTLAPTTAVPTAAPAPTQYVPTTQAPAPTAAVKATSCNPELQPC